MYSQRVAQFTRLAELISSYVLISGLTKYLPIVNMRAVNIKRIQFKSFPNVTIVVGYDGGTKARWRTAIAARPISKSTAMKQDARLSWFPRISQRAELDVSVVDTKTIGHGSRLTIHNSSSFATHEHIRPRNAGEPK